MSLPDAPARYERYGAQGGGFGSLISPELGRINERHVVGMHLNALVTMTRPSGDPAELADLTASERAASPAWNAGSGNCPATR